jgi:predicted RNA-binding Zn-ribbon protein involved in translation (DUF1610 family)
MTQRMQIVVECPDCGDMRVSPEDVTVRSCIDTDEWSYRFICPKCQLRTIGRSVTAALLDAVDAGADFEAWTLPAGLDEEPTGPPFTLADVLEMHLLLLEPDWFDDLVRDHGAVS